MVMAAQHDRMKRASRDAEARGEATAAEFDRQAWLDERASAAMAMQDDAELLARRWGPEPEFMLATWGESHAC